MSKVSKTAIKAAATANIKAAKLQAKRLNEALAELGLVIPHGQALELVAKTMGARTWHAHQADLEKAAQPSVVPEWNPENGPMTFEQYRTKPCTCVVCGYDMIEGDEVDIQDGLAVQEVGCPECGSEWEDIYTLSRFNNLRIGDEAAPSNPELEKVMAWLKAGPMTEDEIQENLDDMVLDDAQEFGTEAANQTAKETSDEPRGPYTPSYASVPYSVARESFGDRSQEDELDEADRVGAEINNRGPIEQLRYLCKNSGSMKVFKSILAVRFNVRESDLKL